MKNQKEKTTAISVRVPEDLKEEFFDYLEHDKQSTFSKWLRAKMREELEGENE